MNVRGLYGRYAGCIVVLFIVVISLIGCAGGSSDKEVEQLEIQMKKQSQVFPVETPAPRTDRKQQTTDTETPSPRTDSKQQATHTEAPAPAADRKQPSNQLNISATDADQSSRITDKKQMNTFTKPLILKKSTQPVRGIYVTSYVANSNKLKRLIKLVDQTELNAMVLDVNSGISLASVTHANTNNPSFTPSNKRAAKHYREVIQQLKKHNIYLIARITTFKDPQLASAVPAWTIKSKNGKVWKDRSGSPWIDPYQQSAWEYTMDIADYAAKLGFDEIQYDYVRFPENEARVNTEVRYKNNQGWTKSEAVSRFLHQAGTRAHQAGVMLSADVFGLVGSSNNDMGIGQSWNAIVKEVDVISPMIYPSHYSKGMWGIDHPDLHPGTIIAHALKDADLRNRKLNHKGITTAAIRPWLQSFTASWIHPHQKYGHTQIEEQIQSARKSGIQSYLLWNSSNRYPFSKL
jgi:hypothetical protein